MHLNIALLFLWLDKWCRIHNHTYIFLNIYYQGLVSQQVLDENELDNIPVRKLKAFAVQTRIQAKLIDGRKQGRL